MAGLSPRRKWLMDVAREAGDANFDPETELCLIDRDTTWYALSLLFDEREQRRDLGKTLLRKTRCEDATHTPATLLAMYHSIPELLTSDLKTSFRSKVVSRLTAAADEKWKDGNVNHPLAAYCTLILGGELAGERWAQLIGLRRLAEFRQVIGDRRGRKLRQAEMSEYNSPTYTALDLWFLALIAEHAEADEARSLALFLEHRLWVDVAMHFHAPSAQFAGPHSRSYQDDSWGGYSALHCTMFAAFDVDLPLFPELGYRFEHPSSLVENALVAIIPFHVPDEARRIALEKPFPYYFRKTTYGESYHENVTGDDGRPTFDEELYAGGWSDLTTYMTPEFTLGTAALPYVNAGHADSVMVRVRRSENIESLCDIRSIYTRGVFNDARPGQRNHSHVSGSEIDASYLYEEGRCATYQHRNRAIVNYAPKRAGHRGVSSFRTDILITYETALDKLLVNGRPPTNFPMNLPQNSRILFRDYRTCCAIMLLDVEPNFATTPARLWEYNDYLLVSMINFEADPTDFTREEIGRWRSGFVIDMVTLDEAGTFDDFVARIEAVGISEEIGPDASRTTIVEDGPTSMEFQYDPLREMIISRRWNGAEDEVEHLSVECPDSSGLFTPQTLFGHELFKGGTP